MTKEYILSKKIRKQLDEYHKKLKETGIPHCMKCGKPMKNAYDSRMKKISPYLWEYDCECHPKNERLAIV